MRNRDWQAGPIHVVLALDLRTPALQLTWPPIPSVAHSAWVDEASFSLDLLGPEGPLWRVVASVLGGPLTTELRAAAATGRRPGEQQQVGFRRWVRTVGRGFLPGDLDTIDALTVTLTGAIADGYTHQYGARSGEWETRLSLPQLADPTCPARATFTECLARVDSWLREVAVLA